MVPCYNLDGPLAHIRDWTLSMYILCYNVMALRGLIELVRLFQNIYAKPPLRVVTARVLVVPSVSFIPQTGMGPTLMWFSDSQGIHNPNVARFSHQIYPACRDWVLNPGRRHGWTANHYSICASILGRTLHYATHPTFQFVVAGEWVNERVSMRSSHRDPKQLPGQDVARTVKPWNQQGRSRKWKVEMTQERYCNQWHKK